MKKALKNYLKKLQENKEKGFSLVELIIVMAIMAILVGVVASQVIPYMEKSRQAKDQQQLSSVGTAIVSSIADSAVVIPTGGITGKKITEIGNTDVLGETCGTTFAELMGETSAANVQTSVADKLKSDKAKKDKTIYFSVSTKGVVQVWIGATTYAAAPSKLKVETE